jgi:protein phosphatase 1L
VVPDVGAALNDPQVAAVGFFAVFDGHLGWSAAEFAQQNLLKNILTDPLIATNPAEAMVRGFVKTDQQYIGSPPPPEQQLSMLAGTTAACALIDYHRRRVIVANAGDSRVVLCRGGTAVALTRDHTCAMLSPEEKEAVSRTRAAAVINTHMWVSVPGSGSGRFARGSSLSLEVTRALGDPLFKLAYNPMLAAAGRDLVSCVPDVLDAQMDADCEFLVLATDGLFGVLSNDDVVAVARGCSTAQLAADTLVQTALKRGCPDNVSVVVIRL